MTAKKQIKKAEEQPKKKKPARPRIKKPSVTPSKKGHDTGAGIDNTPPNQRMI